MVWSRCLAALGLIAVVPGCDDDVVSSLDGSTGTGGGITTTGDIPMAGTTGTPEPDPEGTTSGGESGEEETGEPNTTGPVRPGCGDGVVDAGEECDDGPNNGDDQSCKSDCTLAFCGDGELGPDEECDDGSRNGPAAECRDDCTLAFCGDAQLDPGEECDDGDGINWNECTNACRLPVCGDGLHSSNEECDDGEDNAHSGPCLPGCHEAFCGDGHVWVGVETCDDGNDDETDFCLSTCEHPACGDGVLHPSTEACDDGNDDETDACLSSCEAASCGDGYVQAGAEDCDDTNLNETDGCLSNCTFPGCGNGFVEPGEQCDDGNMDENDSCANDCTLICPEGEPIYVDADATGMQTGESWDDAFPTIAAAMAAASEGDSLWVAEGTYRPTAPNGPVAQLETCVSIYGGFMGTEALLSDRPVPLAPTTLSGDFAADDDVGGFNENARHVVTGVGVGSALLDGLLVRAGRATGLGTAAVGGGLYAVDSFVHLRNVTIDGNTAVGDGGGVYAESSELRLTGGTVANNTAGTGGGLAMHDTSVRFDNGQVSDNAASSDGGGVWFDDESDIATFESYFTLFSGNDAIGEGGGAYLRAGDIALLATDFVDNSAGGSGAGIAAAENQSFSMDIAFFGENLAGASGGGLLLDNTTATLLNELTFSGNEAVDGGGLGVLSSTVETPIVGVFTNNVATDRGGAGFIQSSDTTFAGCSVEGNDALAAGLYSESPVGGYDLLVSDSTFASNLGAGIRTSRVDVTISNSAFEQNEGSGLHTSRGEIDVSDSTFTSNSRGIYVFLGGASVIRRSRFDSNSQLLSAAGGGVYASNVTIDILSSDFVGNSATTHGGAVALVGTGADRILDCTFVDNVADDNGGALYASGVGSATLSLGSSSFRGNAATNGGGVYLGADPSGASLRNLAFWGNGGDLAGDPGAPSPSLEATCSEFFLEAGGGNIVLTSDPFEPGPDGELFLLPTALCVDAGSNVTATSDYTVIGLDWADLSTQQDGSLDVGTVDMGAHYVVE